RRCVEGRGKPLAHVVGGSNSLRWKQHRRDDMSKRGIVGARATLGCATLAVGAIAIPALAADVTSERLLNAPNDPQNWLMVHRDYNNSRHSPLKDINRANAKDLKLKFIMSIGGRSLGGTLRGKEE